MNLLPSAPAVLQRSLRALTPGTSLAPAPLTTFEHEGFERAADFRADVAALPAEFKRLYEAHLHLERTPAELSAAEVLAARRAMALAYVAISDEEARLDRRLTDLDDRRRVGREQLDAARARKRAAADAPLPTDAPDPLWLGLWSVGVPVVALFLLIFYLNSIYLGFFPSAPLMTGSTAQAQGSAYLNALALFRLDLAQQAISAVMPLLGAAAVLVLALVLSTTSQQPTARRRYAALMVGTLGLDLLLAHCIHRSAADARHLMNLPESSGWDVALQFGLIVGFGFGMTYLLSQALGHLFEQRALRQPEYRRQHALREAEAAVTNHEATLAAHHTESEALREAGAAAITRLRQEITQQEVGLLHPREHVTYDGRLRAILDHYHAGWLRFVGQRGLPLAPHFQAYDAFLARQFTDRAGVSTRGV